MAAASLLRSAAGSFVQLPRMGIGSRLQIVRSYVRIVRAPREASFLRPLLLTTAVSFLYHAIHFQSTPYKTSL
jgi:hypothetical protein